jgi:glycosyltransferase 2 family protein
MVAIAPPHLPRAALHATVLAACVGLLAYQLRSVDVAALFTGIDLSWTAGAIGALLLALGAAAHNISAFAPLRLRARDTMRAQLAIGGLRVVAPSAVSTPAIGSRFLARQGLPMPTAMTVLAVAQAAQLIMTILVVAAIAVVASADLPGPGTAELVVGGAVLVALLLLGLVARRLPVGRRILTQAATSARAIGGHLRENPLHVVTGLGASALLTVAHLAAFACCVHAVGGNASVLALTAVYLGAAGAGSLIPTPGGVGAVESALVSGLVASGLSPQLAAAAALLSRLLTVWIPALPGLWALRSLRRDGLV